MAEYDRATHEARMARARHFAVWQTIERGIKVRRFDRVPWMPKTFEAYLAHMREFEHIMSQEREDPERVRERDAAIREAWGQPIRLWHGHVEREGPLGNLGEPTIWGTDWKSGTTLSLPEPPRADWPTRKEYEEEGDERHTSGYGRFLPPPRAISNDTVNWKHRPLLVAYPMDRVCPVPRICAGMQLPGDPIRLEPEYDENGIPIDDYAESGHTALADPRATPRRGGRLGGQLGGPSGGPSSGPLGGQSVAPSDREICELPQGKVFPPRVELWPR